MSARRSDFYDDHTWNLLRYRERLLGEYFASLPEAPLAQKMYGQDNKRLSDATRSFVSPLGGQAVSKEMKR